MSFAVRFLFVLALVAGGGGFGFAQDERVLGSEVLSLREIEVSEGTLMSMSPDGRRILRETPDGGFCVHELATLDELGCTSPMRYVDSLVWSPDGNRLAFTEGALKFLVESDLWVFEVDAGKLENLTFDAFDRPLIEADNFLLDLAPSFSPDGETLTFFRGVRSFNYMASFVMTMPAGGGALTSRALISNSSFGAGAYGLHWSDGDHLVYTVSRHPDDDRNGVWIVAAAGTDRQLLGSQPELGPPTALGASGSWVLVFYLETFEREVGGDFALLELSSGEVVPLRGGQGGETVVRNAVLSPDGSSVLYSYFTPDDNLIRLAVRELPDGEERVLITQSSGQLGAFRLPLLGGSLGWAADGTIFAATGPQTALVLTVSP